MITAYNTYVPITRGVYVGAQKAKMGLVEPDSSLRNNSSLVLNKKGNNDNTHKVASNTNFRPSR